MRDDLLRSHLQREILLWLELSLLLCNTSVVSGLTYKIWSKEAIYLIPKKEDDDRVTKQRPLKLQETLRKLTVNIQRKRMTKVWRKLKLLSPDQYAFVNAGSTTEPALLKKLVIEDAAFHGKDLAVCDEDMSKAYDTASPFILELALRRLGLPYTLIDWFLEFHRSNIQTVVTPYGR